MRRRDRLTVFGMALYCGIIFAVFLAWGMRSGAVNDLPGQERGAVFETISFGSKRNGSEPPKKTAGGISFSPRTPLKRPKGYRPLETMQSPGTVGVIQAEPLIYVAPETVQVAEFLDECVEMPAVHVIEDCTVTYYCAEQYAHICGTGDGITATGGRVTPGVTCAVDPSVIPFGSVVCVDYGDGVLHEYVAQDSGAWVNEDHIDICVETHSKALELGTRTATVYWETV